MISIIIGYHLNITDAIINYKHDAIDTLTTKTKFIIIIGYYLNLLYPKAMRIYIYGKIRYNMAQIKVEVDVCGTFGGMTFVFNIFGTISTLASVVNAFLIILDEIYLILDKVRKYEDDYYNCNTTVIVNIF